MNIGSLRACPNHKGNQKGSSLLQDGFSGVRSRFRRVRTPKPNLARVYGKRFLSFVNKNIRKKERISFTFSSKKIIFEYRKIGKMELYNYSDWKKRNNKKD